VEPPASATFTCSKCRMDDQDTAVCGAASEAPSVMWGARAGVDDLTTRRPIQWQASFVGNCDDFEDLVCDVVDDPIVRPGHPCVTEDSLRSGDVDHRC